MCRIVAGALLLRVLLLAVSTHSQTALTPDSGGYLRLADNLRLHGVFSRAANAPFVPEIERTPIYPIFLAAIFTISDDLVSVLFAQCLLDVAACVLLIYLGWRVWDERSAFYAGFFMATSLGAIVSSVTILAETLFTFFLILHAIAFIALFRFVAQNWKWPKLLPRLTLAALTLSCVTLTRPIGLYLIILEVLLILWQFKHRWQSKAAMMTLYILVYLIGLSPWIIRNWVLFRAPMVSMISSYNLYFYNAAYLESYTTGLSYENVQVEFERRAQQRFKEVGIVGSSLPYHDLRSEFELRELEPFRKAGIPDSLIAIQAKTYRELAMQIILRQPLTYLRLHLAYNVKSFLPSTTELYQRLGILQTIPSTLEVLESQGIGAAALNYFGGELYLFFLALPAIVLLLFMYTIFFLGCYNLVKRHRWWPFSFMIFMIVYLALIPGVVSEPRFGVPIMPFIALIAGNGMSHFLEKKINFYRHSTTSSDSVGICR